jgi:hypothetical protein
LLHLCSPPYLFLLGLVLINVVRLHVSPFFRVVMSDMISALKRLYSHSLYRRFLFFCVFIYVYWCPRRFPWQLMFVSFNSYTTGFTSGAETAKPYREPTFTSDCSGFRVARSLVFCVVFCRSLVSFCSFLLAILLSVFLRCKNFDNPLGIFKLVL